MMRERAEAVGAQLTMASRPGHGTDVTLHWPGTQKQEVS
jgi:signal transduction histidine kinase